MRAVDLQMYWPVRAVGGVLAIGVVRRARMLLARLVCLGLSSAIVVVSSEKFYWYPQGFSAVGFLELVGFYAFPFAAMLWVVERYDVASTWSLVLASGVFALGLEGIVTPVGHDVALESGPREMVWPGRLSMGER